MLAEVLRLALKANNLGYSPRRSSRISGHYASSTELGRSFYSKGCSDLSEQQSLWNGEIEQLQKKWYESGKWHGKYLNEKFKDPVQALKKFLKATRWDLSEVEVKKTENTVKFRCISTLLTGEGTKLLVKFIEGAMHSMGYQTDKSDTLKGMIILEFKK